ncbi:hypothetical protein MMC24_004487 [Lignoscripta atroalba]|nr:hypothetical protein [Lignoscripta atroalba]
MPGSRKYALAAATLLLFARLWLIQAEPTVNSISPSIFLNSSDGTTCPVRSVNYITQTLAQQCLTISWASQKTDQSFVISASPNTTAGTEHKTPSTEPSSGSSSADFPTFPTESAATAALSTAGSLVVSEPTWTSSSATASTASVLQQSPKSDQDQDADSLLDNANFLSFEEWKTQMLKKAGQSPDNIGNPRARGDHSEPRRIPGGISNALDSLGEDTEIELDFGGFVNADTGSEAMPSRRAVSSSDDGLPRNEGEQGQPRGPLHSRSKDAGKTCKERSNFASFDCAATVLKTNPQCKGSTSVLVENKDSYMLNECSASNKFFIVELCDDILIDTVVLANFEFFSSTFRTFRVSVSDRFPVKLDKWRDLGTFEARNSRDVQAFLVVNPLIWARYLRIEFLTHYGNEYYCPISLLRVHGKTMMDDYKHDFKTARGDDEQEDDISEPDREAREEQSAEVITAEVMNDKPKVTTGQPTLTMEDSLPPLTIDLEHSASNNSSDIPYDYTLSNYSAGRLSGVCPASFLIQQYELLSSSCNGSSSPCPFTFTVLDDLAAQTDAARAASTSGIIEMSNITTPAPTGSVPTKTTESPSERSMTTISVSPKQPANGTVDSAKQNSTTSLPSPKSNVNNTSYVVSKTSSQPPPANPTTQESFFKSIHKRLQLLESNSTLSLQYIEEQSRILREAFTKVEKRQLSKTTTFLENLNTTVLNELRDFRFQYDQIWQSTVLELSSQREQSQREVIGLSTRLSLLADEILFQKRMAILQFILILLCLGLVIFSRNTSSPSVNYLELPPLVQNMVNKSSTSISRYSPLESPPGSPPSTRPVSRYGLFTRRSNHERNPSYESIIHDDDDGGGTKSPSIEYSPPTPISDRSRSDIGDTRPQSPALSDGPEADVEARQSQSSPATPSGKRAGQNPLELRKDHVAAVEEVLLRPSPQLSSRGSPLRASDGLDDGEGSDHEVSGR